MGFKPRPVPPPPASPGKTKRGFADKKVASSPGLLRRKISVTKEPEVKKSNTWWNLNEAEESNTSTGGRRSSRTSVPSSKSKGSSTVTPSPSTRSRKSLSSTRTSSTRASSTRTPQPPPTTPVNSTRKILFRHKVSCKGQVLYEWEQNPKFVTIYYPTPNADSKAFCNIAEGHVQLGTKPKGLPTKWFLSHDTGGEVDAEESSWKQCKHHCRIVLKKENKGSTWARALKDDRIDQTMTIKKSRPKVEKAESEPILSPASSKKKWKNPRRRSAVNQSDDEHHDDDTDEESDIDSEEVDGKPKAEEDAVRRRRSNSQGRRSASQPRRRSNSQGQRRSSSQPGQRRKRMSKKQGAPPQRTKSNCSATSDKPMSTIFVEEESPKRRSSSQPKRKSGAAPPQRTTSAHSAGSKPMSTIFVQKESPATPKRRSGSQAKRPPPCRRMSSRSCDNIDENLPFHDIEVDMNSDLISVL